MTQQWREFSWLGWRWQHIVGRHFGVTSCKPEFLDRNKLDFKASLAILSLIRVTVSENKFKGLSSANNIFQNFNKSFYFLVRTDDFQVGKFLKLFTFKSQVQQEHPELKSW
jgi:hypothetical protein